MSLKSLLLVAAVAAVPCTLAFGSTLDGIVTFGDSLSDAGNASIATSGSYPGPGYATRSVTGVPFPVGYYTNPQYGSGPSGLWVDQLSVLMGLPDPTPSLAGGSNYAVASSFTAGYNVLAPGMDSQVGVYLLSNGGHASASDLYTFWGGANDIFNGLNPVLAADNIAHQIEALAAGGGQDFLWLNLPSLGDAPGLSGTPFATGANLASAAFDGEWAVDLSLLKGQGIDVTGVDVNSLFNAVTGDPSAYGFTNVTTACDTTAGCDPNAALYWDSEHPTTEADSLVADLAYSDLNPTPESPTAILIGLGLASFALFRTRLRFA